MAGGVCRQIDGDRASSILWTRHLCSLPAPPFTAIYISISQARLSAPYTHLASCKYNLSKINHFVNYRGHFICAAGFFSGRNYTLLTTRGQQYLSVL